MGAHTKKRIVNDAHCAIPGEPGMVSISDGGDLPVDPVPIEVIAICGLKFVYGMLLEMFS